MPFEMVHFINLSPLSPAAYKDYYELLNPIMFSSSIDKKKKEKEKRKGLCLERGNDALTREQRLTLCLQGFLWQWPQSFQGGETWINKMKK